MIKEAFRKLSYAVFPRRCEICGEVVALDEELCDECKKLKRISGELCKKCGKPKEECSCEKTLKTPEYKAFVAPYYYENSLAAGVNRFKDSSFPELAKRMGKEISAQVDEYFCDIPFDVITFVPITKKKQRKRGYNQSELLAIEVSKELEIPCVSLLSKIKSTPQQKRSSAKERRVNLRGSFDLREGTDVSGKTILLIDDIKTTGSTLNECAYVLNAYGAKRVYAAAFCMTRGK